jgi:flagellar motor switch protein FliG
MASETVLLESKDVGQEVPTPVKVNGATTAAILLMLLDESEAAAILKRFDPEDVRTLGVAMFAASNATEAEIAAALDRFVDQGRSLSTLAVRAEPRIRKVMHEALGNVRADNILADIGPQSSACALDILRWMEVADIARVVTHEHPQVGALIISVLTPEVSAAVLDGFDEIIQADLVCRAAKLTQVPAEAVSDLETILASIKSSCSQSAPVRVGGTGDVARIVNRMKKQSGERVLKSVKKRDKQLGQEIEEEMFIFDNLIDLDTKSLGTLMRSVDASVLGFALKGASAVLVDKILGSMSARAAESIRDDMADRGPVKRAEVEDAQREIISVARNLAEDGTIMLGGGGDDYV